LKLLTKLLKHFAEKFKKPEPPEIGSRWEVVEQTKHLPDETKYIEVDLVKQSEEFGMYVVVDNFDENYSRMKWVREEGTPWETEINSDSLISLDDFNELITTGIIKKT
jgi:hypothetical protein